MWGKWREGLYYPALSDRAVTALADQIAELAPERLKIGDLALHLLEVPAGHLVHRFAGPFPVIGELEQLTHLIE